MGKISCNVGRIQVQVAANPQLNAFLNAFPKGPFKLKNSCLLKYKVMKFNVLVWSDPSNPSNPSNHSQSSPSIRTPFHPFTFHNRLRRVDIRLNREYSAFSISIQFVQYRHSIYCYEIMSDFLRQFIPVADAITLLLKPNTEVVIHDTESDTIFYIANPVSGRKAGDSSHLGLDLDTISASDSVIGPYEKAGKLGQRIQSISAILRDTDQIAGLLCINLDFSGFEPALELLEALIRPQKLEKPPEILFKNDWLEQIRFEIRTYAENHQVQITGFTPKDRKILMAQLDSKRLLYAKNSIEQISSILNISRATAYNDLKEARKLRSSNS